MTKNHPISIAHEDEYYIVFDKPAGVLVIPSPKNELNTLVSIVNQQFIPENSMWKLHPCHRLDRETSGVILFAKGKKLQQKMMDLFHQRKITKRYMAFIHGQLQPKQGEIKNRTKSFESRQYGRSAAKDSVSRYKVCREYRDFSVVEVEPVTGRTNQIRIHFSQIKHPLLGERKYAIAKDYKLKFRRAALHAKSLEFIHPITGKAVYVQADLPDDMKMFLKQHE